MFTIFVLTVFTIYAYIKVAMGGEFGPHDLLALTIGQVAISLYNRARQRDN